MPRRIPDYPDAFAGWNMISSIGSYIAFASSVMFVCMMVYLLFAGRRVTAANPWGLPADTLEWTVPCPAPHHTFEELPKIAKTAHH
jgi:cytochrome c oxidase subunit 1